MGFRLARSQRRRLVLQEGRSTRSPAASRKAGTHRLPPHEGLCLGQASERVTMTAVTGASDRLFRRLMTEIYLESMVKKHRGAYEDQICRFLLGQERDEDRMPLEPLTARQRLFLDLSRVYREILLAVTRIKMASQFLENLRPRRTTADVIAYHVEKHLEEAYILRERINTFMRRLQRQLKKRSLHEEASEVDRLREIVIKGFTEAVLVRGSHVHEERFTNLDMHRIEVLDMLMRLHKGGQALQPLRRLQARWILGQWRTISRRNAQAVQKIADSTAVIVEPIIFGKLAPE